jgi:hypothetical protein
MDRERYKLFPKLGVRLRIGHTKGTDNNKCNQSEKTTKNRYFLTRSSVLLHGFVILICYYYYYYYICFHIHEGIYNYISKTNHVSRVHNVAATLWLLFTVGLHVMLFAMITVVYLHVSTFQTCAQCPILQLPVVPLCCAFQVCCSVIFGMIQRWFQLFSILLVSLLFLQSTYAVHLLWGLYIFKSSQLYIIIIIIIIIIIDVFYLREELFYLRIFCNLKIYRI